MVGASGTPEALESWRAALELRGNFLSLRVGGCRALAVGLDPSAAQPGNLHSRSRCAEPTCSLLSLSGQSLSKETWFVLHLVGGKARGWPLKV